MYLQESKKFVHLFVREGFVNSHYRSRIFGVSPANYDYVICLRYESFVNNLYKLF